MRIYKRFFGAIYDRFMHSIEERKLKTRRARLLSGLSGKVLEIGVGTGTNFEHYNDKIELTGIEPSPFMIRRAEKKRDVLLFPNRITLLKTGCGYPEMEKLIQPGTLDAVVCTLVLCTVPDPIRAMKNFQKWLKPGGRLLILEHIRSHNPSNARFQDMVNPLWKKVADGCNLNRSTDRLLEESGFQLVREERFRIGLPFYEAEYNRP
jgi:SAM-dependent methyltransferase